MGIIEHGQVKELIKTNDFLTKKVSCRKVTKHVLLLIYQAVFT